MNKKLWIQDIENAQKLFYIIEDMIRHNSKYCLITCEFYFSQPGIDCLLFKEILRNGDFGRLRCERCVRIFGE